MSKQDTTFRRRWTQRASYALMRQAARVLCLPGFGIRCFGRENLPADGGALICANHQSNLDPPLIGMIFDRRINYLAKKSLFDKQPLKALIEHLDAIPIDRNGVGLSGIKETIRRLRRGEIVLMFPEGQRTFDGEMSPMMPGFCALTRRAKVPMVPIGFDGAFDSWPRGTMFPRPARIYMVVGKPISPEEYSSLSNAESVALLNERIIRCFEEARQRRRHSFGRG